jgi:hypothetical protein
MVEETEISISIHCEAEINPGNPAYSSVFQPNCRALFDAKPNIVPTLGLRLRQALLDYGVNLNCIAERLIPSKPPWLFRTQVLTIRITMWVQKPTHLLIYIFLFT